MDELREIKVAGELEALNQEPGHADKMSVLEFATKHFAVLSSLTTVTILSLSTIFLSSYLAVFDSQAVWIIEYTDVIKFALVLLASIAAYVGLAQAYLEDIIVLVTDQTPESAGRRRGAILGFSILISTWFLSDGATDGPTYYNLHIHYVGSLLLIAAIVFWTHRLLSRPDERVWKTYVQLLFVVIFGAGLFGSTYGIIIKENGKFDHQVITKNSVFDKVEVILILYRNSVFYDKQNTIIIHTDDIVQMQPVNKLLSPN